MDKLTMYFAVFIYIFFECIFVTRSTLTYTIYESELNPKNIKMKIDGSIEFPTRNSKSVEHPKSLSAENDSYEELNLTSKISGVGLTSVKDTGKTDKKESNEKNLKFWKGNNPGLSLSDEVSTSEIEEDKETRGSVNDSIAKLGRVMIASVKETDDTLVKDTSREKSSNEDGNDSTEKLSRVVPASSKVAGRISRENNSNEDDNDSTEKLSRIVPASSKLAGKISRENNSNKDENDSTESRMVPVSSKVAGETMYNELSSEKHSKAKKKTKHHGRVVATALKESDKALDKEFSRGNNSHEDFNDSVTNTDKASGENNSNENENDSTEKFGRMVPDSSKVAGKTMYNELSSEKHSKAKKKAKHSRVVATSLKETGKALDKEFSRGNNSHEDFNDSMTNTDEASGKHIARKSKLHRIRRPESAGVTLIALNTHHKVQDDRRIRRFTDYVYQQTLKAFENMKKISDSYTKEQIVTLVKSYKDKFTDFVTKTREIDIKTRKGGRNALIHIIETSNLLLSRIVNFLKANNVATDELGLGGLKGWKLRLDQGMAAARQLAYEHACKSFGVCRNSDGIRTVFLDLISILLKLPDDKLVLFNDAATEQLKNMDFSKLGISDEIVQMIKKKIKHEEKIGATELRFRLTIFYGALSKSHLPFIVNKAVYFERSAVRRTVDFLSLVDALEEALPPTEANKREWAMAKDRLKRWAEGHPLDIQEILQAFFENIMNGVAKSKKMKELIAKALTPIMNITLT